MSNMKFTSPRATFDELLAFANVVRKAGGGNPLDALMPSVPSDATRCLIARNLNFNCSVSQHDFRGQSRWAMVTDQMDVRDKIAKALHLAKVNLPLEDAFSWGYPVGIQLYGVILPLEIGQVAEDFDRSQEVLVCLHDEDADGEYEAWDSEESRDRSLQFLKEFLPYIEGSEAEVAQIGTLNSNGLLVL